MRILIEERVHQAIESFYDAAILKHWHTLSFDTVENKKNRLYDGLESLANYATIFPKARLKIHFAYEITVDAHGEKVIVVHDAVHSFLYY